jgi:hypothetical protein
LRQRKHQAAEENKAEASHREIVTSTRRRDLPVVRCYEIRLQVFGPNIRKVFQNNDLNAAICKFSVQNIDSAWVAGKVLDSKDLAPSSKSNAGSQRVVHLRFFRIEFRKVLLNRDLSGLGLPLSSQNIAFTGLTCKILFSNNLAAGRRHEVGASSPWTGAMIRLLACG